MSDVSDQVRIEVRDGICLTEIRTTDKSAFVNHLNDKDIFNNTLCIPYPYSDEDAAQFMAIVTEATAEHGHPVHFAVRGDDDLLIGGCGFDGLNYEHRAEIGYWLGKPYWGRGIMTDVVRSACSWRILEVEVGPHQSVCFRMGATGHAPEWGCISERGLTITNRDLVCDDMG